ncbi:MAG: right-handed parallel beta-helix repeat-containing protein, partial [Moorella sp. (in: Bacteria)]|nr:right-handed parallel beta-helix repeat-containing protein [Moorella sp. (in: firmicutes)]
GVTLANNTFKYNATGVAIRDSNNVGMAGSSLISGSDGSTGSGDQIGLSITGSTAVSIREVIFAWNSTGVLITESDGVDLAKLVCRNNTTGLQGKGNIGGEVRSSTFTANKTGVDLLEASAPGLIFRENNFYNNETGVRSPAQASLAVAPNYWGSSSGPKHNPLNPSGHGDLIEGNLDFIPWAPYAYYCDNVPPEITLTLPATIWLSDEPVELQLSVAEETWLDRVTLAVYDPRMETVTGKTWWRDEWDGSQGFLTWTPPGGVDGSYWVKAAAVDGKGNQSQVENKIVVDRYPPANPRVLINGGAEVTSELNVELTLTAEDASGVTEIMIFNEGGPPGAWEPYQESRTWQLLDGSPGLRQVTVRFRDGVGRESAAGASIIFNPPPPNPGTGHGNLPPPGQEPS